MMSTSATFQESGFGALDKTLNACGFNQLLHRASARSMAVQNQFNKSWQANDPRVQDDIINSARAKRRPMLRAEKEHADKVKEAHTQKW